MAWKFVKMVDRMLDLHSRLDFVCRYKVLIGNGVAWWDGNGIELTVPCAMTATEKSFCWMVGSNKVIEEFARLKPIVFLEQHQIKQFYKFMQLCRYKKHDLVIVNVAAYRNKQTSSSIVFFICVVVLN